MYNLITIDSNRVYKEKKVMRIINKRTIFAVVLVIAVVAFSTLALAGHTHVYRVQTKYYSMGPNAHYHMQVDICSCGAKNPQPRNCDGPSPAESHVWSAATCTTACKCYKCGQTGSKDPDNHSVNTATGKCYRCGKQLFNPKK